MTSEEVKQNLDNANSELLAKIEKNTPVIFKEKEITSVISEKRCYESVLRKSEPIHAEVFFYTPISQEKIAHELLHMYIACTFGDCADIIYIDPKCIFTTCLFTDTFCTDLLNQSEHVLMYPLYKRMGYDSDLFVESLVDMHDAEYQSLLSYGIQNKGLYSSRNVDFFIRLCIYYMSFPLDNRYKRKCKQLRSIEKSLYSIIETYFNQLRSITLTSPNSKVLQQIYKSLRDNIARWVNSRNIRYDGIY